MPKRARNKKGSPYIGKRVVVTAIRPKKRRDDQRSLDYRKALIRQERTRKIAKAKKARLQILRRVAKKEDKNLLLVSQRSFTKCQKRKIFKKTMMKKLAAQIKAGGKSMDKWRQKRSQNRKTTWEC
jgi:hypothetical protein